MTQEEIDKHFMDIAIAYAMKAKERQDYGIGALITKNNALVAGAGNTRDQFPLDPTVHTETAVIKLACEMLGTRYLTGCTLYSTHAPCAMCLCACVWAKVSRVVYGSTQKDMVEHSKEYGEYGGKVDGSDLRAIKWRGTEIEPEDLYPYLKIANPNMEIVSCFMQEECKKLY